MDSARPGRVPKAVLSLPKKIVDEINRLIDAGLGHILIHRKLVEQYGKDCKIPYLLSIYRYKKWYLIQHNRYVNTRGKDAKEITRISSTPIVSPVSADKVIAPLIENAEVIEAQRKDIFSSNQRAFDKKDALENLIKKCSGRIELIEQMQNLSGIKPQMESLLSRYISEIRQTIVDMAKLSGELQKETTQYVINVMDTALLDLLNCVFKTIEEVYGKDRIPDVKARLKEKFQKMSSLQNLTQGVKNEKT